jgi:hypothetical protein
LFVRVAKKNKQTAHNTPHLDDEVEEDEETESFAALEGEALVITSPYGIFYLLKSYTNYRKRNRICRRSKIFENTPCNSKKASRKNCWKDSYCQNTW